MRRAIPLALAVAVILIGVASPVFAAGVLSDQQAKQEFASKGCSSCHNGGLAPTFEGVVKKIREWASTYPSLDKAVESEAPHFKMFQNAKTWDQLMSMKPGMTPELKAYFEHVFNSARGAGAGQAATTTISTASATSTTATASATTTTSTQAPAATTTAATTPSYTTLPSVATPNPSQQSKGLVNTALPIGIAVLVIAIVALAVALLRARR
ncbi:hypothetical protein CF15_02405 [Pyrodictium occultum]|uniref:Cytochrome c domain-containing protein n=1 Tax=Pyrodictium occultum TaxID=2309 RepID=A0A0V8RUE3_PYROC|nr:hypothetical protein [Pyrodictium occultum]KSW11689.1 hypothetical protein CF15_02405 [Pyrodictium occultum]